MKTTYTSNSKVQNNSFFPQKISEFRRKVLYFQNWEPNSTACNFKSSAETQQGKGNYLEPMLDYWECIMGSSSCSICIWGESNHTRGVSEWVVTPNRPWEKPCEGEWLYLFWQILRPEFVFFSVFYSPHGSWCRKTIEMSKGDTHYCKFCLLQLRRVIWKL